VKLGFEGDTSRGARRVDPDRHRITLSELSGPRGAESRICYAGFMDAPGGSEKFLRTLGRRRPSLGTAPSAEARAAMTEMAQYRTAVPKGVFVYASHEAANEDWERWRIAGMRANTRVETDG
jgi:hypothetical protein